MDFKQARIEIELAEAGIREILDKLEKKIDLQISDVYVDIDKYTTMDGKEYKQSIKIKIEVKL